MKVVESLAYGILGLITAGVMAILACVANPDIGVWVGELLQPADEEEVKVDTSNK